MTTNHIIMTEPTPSKGKRGQSVIEFAVVSAIFISMIYLSYNAVMAFAFQQYVSHATFMAARAYQAGHENPATQRSSAEVTLAGYLPGYETGEVRLGNSNIRARNVSATFPSADPSSVPAGSGMPVDSVVDRVSVTFSMPLVALPLGQGGDWDAVETIDFEVSSFLGREPTRVECYDYFQRLLTSLAIPGAPGYHQSAMTSSSTPYALADNGC